MAKLVKHTSSALKLIISEAMKDQSGNNLRVWDLMSSADTIMYFMMHDTDPIYIAFRHQGCEVGSLDYVRESCRVLGEPYNIYKLSHDDHVVISDITIENLNCLYE